MLFRRGFFRTKKIIFINYRKEDSEAEAQKLFSNFREIYGSDCLFIDSEAIQGGRNWLQEIDRHVASSVVMLSLIGSKWITDRLNDHKDVVRREIALAIGYDRPVIPILLNDTPMPTARQLPDDLLPLTLYQGMRLRETHLAKDLERIHEHLNIILGRASTQFPWREIAVGALGLALGAGVGAQYNTSDFVLFEPDNYGVNYDKQFFQTTIRWDRLAEKTAIVDSEVLRTHDWWAFLRLRDTADPPRSAVVTKPIGPFGFTNGYFLEMPIADAMLAQYRSQTKWMQLVVVALPKGVILEEGKTLASFGNDAKVILTPSQRP